MARITESQLSRSLITNLSDHRTNIAKLNEQISTGIAVGAPGDSTNSGVITGFQQALERAVGYKNRIALVKDSITFQDNVLTQAEELMIRAKEIAVQASNTTNSEITRRAMAEEVFQLRDHMVSLANSTYQGRYVFGGVDDDDPPYDAIAPYTNPSSGNASIRYAFDAELGTSTQRTVKLTDDLSMTVNTPGNQLFDEGIQALERLGRSLAGYATNPAVGAPDGTGNAYVFPGEFPNQTADIRATIDLFDTARTDDIIPERVNLSGKLRRIETAESLLKLTTESSQDALDQLQNTDIFEAASKLTQAQTALQASIQVSAQVFQLSIMDYL